MKRLIGCTAALCLLIAMVGCGGVTSSGTLAYISNASGTGFTVYTVNTDGTLTKSSISPQNTPAAPLMLQFSANGKWAYFLDKSGTTIYAYTRSGNGVLTTLIDSYPSGSGPASALVISPNNNFLYVAYPGTGRLAVYGIDASTGKLSQVGNSAQINYSITQLVMAPGGTILYGLAPTQQAVLTFTLNTSSGLATLASALPVGTLPSYIVLSANGSYLYVLDRTATGTNNSAGIPTPSIFGYNTSGSTLQAISGSPFNENPISTTDPSTGQQTFVANSVPVGGVTSNDNRYLFVVNQGSHNISVFKILTANGAAGELSEVIGSTGNASPFDCGTGCTTPSFVTISGSNNALYVLDPGVQGSAGKIFQYRIDQNIGRVRPATPASVAAEGNPTWMTLR